MINKIEKAMKQAKVSIEIEEGIQIKPEHSVLVKSRLNNEITEEEFRKKIKNLLK